jgi:hypothetical protein
MYCKPPKLCMGIRHQQISDEICKQDEIWKQDEMCKQEDPSPPYLRENLEGFVIETTKEADVIPAEKHFIANQAFVLNADGPVHSCKGSLPLTGD